MLTFTNLACLNILSKCISLTSILVKDMRITTNVFIIKFTNIKIVYLNKSVQGTHVSLAGDILQSVRDGRTVDWRTERRWRSDPYVSLCYAGDTKTAFLNFTHIKTSRRTNTHLLDDVSFFLYSNKESTNIQSKMEEKHIHTKYPFCNREIWFRGTAAFHVLSCYKQNLVDLFSVC